MLAVTRALGTWTEMVDRFIVLTEFARNKFQQAGLRVWVRAPTMNLGWIWQAHPDWRIPVMPAHARAGDLAPWYFRVSPELEPTHTAVRDFYTDMAVYLPLHLGLAW